MPTADPYEGTADVALMPTYRCGACGAWVWDEQVHAALGEVRREDGLPAVNDCVAGAECPACGEVQQG